MSSFSLNAISAVDGRYLNKTAKLSDYLSEAALMRYRVVVEARWVLFIENKIKSADLNLSQDERKVLEHFSQATNIKDDDVAAIKKIETVTNHDVKACEYFLRDKLQECSANERVQAFLHFGCTSEDINNTAYALMYRDAVQSVLLPQLKTIQETLKTTALDLVSQPMLARTHGQTASPTTIGKELAVFCHRQQKVIEQIEQQKYEAKFNGAVGNYNAHAFTYPAEDWPALAESFVTEHLGLSFNPLTTQIENHDWISVALDNQRRYNVIAIGLCRDIWTYISQGYFKQKVVAGEVGSSTMPHKVNPIDFENAEGNFGVANSIAVHLSEKLLISRLQRDLSDSTALRSLGTVFGHTTIALASLTKGLSKIELNRERLIDDLNLAWEVLAEPVQTILRANGVVDAYEQLKAATRGQGLGEESYLEFINGLKDLTDEQRSRLRSLRPDSYVGLAAEIARRVLK